MVDPSHYSFVKTHRMDTPSMNCNGNYRLWAIMMCQYRLTNCYKCPFWEAVDSGEAMGVQAGAGGIVLSVNFAENLKLFKKNKIYFSIYMYHFFKVILECSVRRPGFWSWPCSSLNVELWGTGLQYGRYNLIYDRIYFSLIKWAYIQSYHDLCHRCRRALSAGPSRDYEF